MFAHNAREAALRAESYTYRFRCVNARESVGSSVTLRSVLRRSVVAAPRDDIRARLPSRARKREEERRACTGFAVDPDSASMPLNDALCDVQTEPRAAAFSQAANRPVRFEDCW